MEQWNTNSGWHGSFARILQRNQEHPVASLKLGQVSTYFGHNFPFIGCQSIRFGGLPGNIQEWRYQLIQGGLRFYDIQNDRRKLWVLRKVQVVSTFHQLASRIITKIAVCRIQELNLQNQRLTLHEFNILRGAGDLRNVILLGTSITNAAGEIVPIEDILALLPNINIFKFMYNEITTPTLTPLAAANIVDNINAGQLQQLGLCQLTDGFNLDVFRLFMMTLPDIQFELSFIGHLAQPFHDQLQDFVDEMNTSPLMNFPAIHVSFPNMDPESEAIQDTRIMHRQNAAPH